jgi:hypothetical protein
LIIIEKCKKVGKTIRALLCSGQGVVWRRYFQTNSAFMHG